ncbi:MAG: efflux RND transporter periplasmic adaptor subunit [Bacteroidales bacterium]|nr:efflux RND transporter periplasmic adaptor subunit [Bacteroidales bacterium]
MNRFKKNLLGLLGLAAATCVVTSCGGDKQQQQVGAAPQQVETMTIALSSTEINATYPATIKGKTDVEIRPQVSGFITRVLVDEGQHVRKGQALFEIDKVQYESAVRSAEALVASAKAQVSTARLTADNKRKLFEKNIISDYEYQTATLSLQSAEASLNQAKAQLVNARKNLSYATVVAPCDGVVGMIPNREGSLASPSSAQALTTVSDNSKVYAYFSFNEKDVLEMTQNGTRTMQAAINEMPEVKLRLSDGTIYPFTGKVSTVSGVLNATTGTATVRALFDNKNGMLRSGSTGNVLIPQQASNVILIPQQATYEVQDMKYVYVVNDSSIAHARIIKVDPIDNGKQYVVRDGLKVGEVIVTEGVGVAVREGTAIAKGDAKAAK